MWSAAHSARQLDANAHFLGGDLTILNIVKHHLHVCLQLVEFICLDSWSGTSIIDWSTGGARCYIIAAKLGIRIRAHSWMTALELLSPGLSSSTLINLGQFWYILWLNSQTKQTKGQSHIAHSGMLLQTITKVTDKSHKRNTLMLPMQPNNTLF